MNFSTNNYFIFFVVSCAIRIVISKNFKQKITQISIILLLNCLFFGSSSVEGLILLISVAFFDYFSAILSLKFENKKRLFLIGSICFNLIILGFFKYAFFLINLSPLFFINLINFSVLSYLKIGILPGISFFIFQSMSYSIDVFRGKIPAERSFLKYLFFLSFFPQLIAGPIVKAKDFLNQIDGMFTKDLEYRRILFYFLSGILKKSVLSDGIAPIVDTIFNFPGNFSSGSLFLGMLGFSCQIYLDFSGYSDFARGSALAFGIELPENFLFPYSASSFSEFWRRWHISLSDWLKNYLYISIGGNRQGEYRTYLNLMITMLIGGLWHGPSWNFVFWGFGHGLFLALERFLGWNQEADFALNAGRFWSYLRSGFVFLSVSFLWIPFRSSDFKGSFEFIRRIFASAEGLNLSYSEQNRLYFVLFAVLLFSFLGRKFYEKTENWLSERLRISDIFLIPLLFMLFVLLSSGGMRPFIYFVF